MIAPRYGTGSLTDLLPSLLGCFDVPGEHDRLGLALDITRVCVLLVDGLGADALAAHPEAAPFLTGTAPRRLTAGFPTTTATSLSSFGTGLPPGEHGIIGYLLRLPEYDRIFDPLGWRLHGTHRKGELLEQLPPEKFQPHPTVFERAAAQGISVTHVAPRQLAGSGLTRLALRGAVFRPNTSIGDLVAGITDALCSAPRTLVYAYHADLDTTGHVRGPSARSWLLELGHVDRIAADIAAQLPPDAALIVTSDHGMVELDRRIDYDTHDDLRAGVHALGGEARARHVYTVEGATTDVRAAWTQLLGPDFLVLTRAEAIERGWFGPRVHPHIVERIGDLVVVALGAGGITRSTVEPVQSTLVGQHGSLTSAEMNVPLCVFTP